MLEIIPLERLTEQFAKLPGIGRKTARRLAYHVLRMPEPEVKTFAQELYQSRMSVKYCSVCGMISDSDICDICSSPKRDKTTVCVVKDSRDVFAIERTGEFSGVYHVLGGTISPLENIGPDDINIAGLMERLGEGVIKEVILATNPDVQGEATASYISRLLASYPDLTVTRIAHGVPVGADLEYADEVTLVKALEGRRKV